MMRYMAMHCELVLQFPSVVRLGPMRGGKNEGVEHDFHSPLIRL